jgi:hypothetical protein
VRYDPRDLSKVYVPSMGVAEYLDVPYAYLRRPPITRAELDRARTILTEKGERHPTEDQILPLPRHSGKSRTIPVRRHAAPGAIQSAAQRRLSVVAAGTHEALHVMRFDRQIASRFEQMELPVWTESDELRRFDAGYLAMLPIRKNSAAIHQRFIEVRPRPHRRGHRPNHRPTSTRRCRCARTQVEVGRNRSATNCRRKPAGHYQPEGRISDLGHHWLPIGHDLLTSTQLQVVGAKMPSVVGQRA